MIKKIYHRAFNLVMRLVMPLFPYREPEVLHDVAHVTKVMAEKGYGRVMIVTDKGVRGLGLTQPLENLIRASGFELTVYDSTAQNPTSHNVEEARAMYVQNQCEVLIAFGGGSAMDCAKAVGARIVRPDKPLKKMQGLIKVRRTLPLFIAIPTTAGTGSETTVAAVITDFETHHKYVINDFSLIPHYALLDPEVTVGLPKHLTATTGMDALTHAVEVYIGKSRTKLTKKAAEDAVKLIFDNLERAYREGTDIEARRNMLIASNLAGVAFTRSYVGYIHAVAHTLGGKYGVPHGLANAVLLPKVLRLYGDSVTKPLAELARIVGVSDVSDTDTAAKEKFIARIERMNEDMQIPDRLDMIREDDVEQLARQAAREANPLYPVPKIWGAKELEYVYLVCAGKADSDIGRSSNDE